MKGFGTVVTGTLISGTIRKEEELEIFPTGKRARVRGIQVHGRVADQAVAGQRTALNLAGAATEELTRGMSLAPPATFRPTSRVDVELSLLPSAKPLKERARLHFHAYTAEAIARVVLYGRKQVAPGETAFAQLRLTDPALLLPGDGFILRQFSPVITVGGGRVLENTPPRKMKDAAAYAGFLKVLAAGSLAEVLHAHLTASGAKGVSLTEMVARTGATVQQVTRLSLTLANVVRITDHFVLAGSLNLLRDGLLSVLDAFHKQNPLVAGMSKEELRAQLSEASPEVFNRAFEDAVKARGIELAGELVHLPGRGVAMKDEEAESRQTIEVAFASAGLKVPAMKDVLAGLKVDKARAQKIVTLLLRDKVLVKISEDLVFHRDALADLRQRMAAEKLKSPRIDVGRFKDVTGVSRKYAIPLLEYLDRERVTRRVGDERVIL